MGLSSTSNVTQTICSACYQGKLAKIPLAAFVEHKSTRPFDIVHFDVWGPFLVLSNLGF